MSLELEQCMSCKKKEKILYAHEWGLCQSCYQSTLNQQESDHIMRQRMKKTLWRLFFQR